MKTLCFNDRPADWHSLAVHDLTAQALSVHDTPLSTIVHFIGAID
jgi:hypothetical protein